MDDVRDGGGPVTEREPRQDDGDGADVAEAVKASKDPKAATKARLVFRDPLDQRSSDDTDAGWGGRPAAGESGGRGLDWYLSQRPPHHGG
ncbi:hypothetical protein ACFWA9_00965 [Kitasatospora sp. NPDC059973]|uniref:hypothetical protein n=1 Tax=Kitasatospora sp. NPDC059973 TaxID=3347020 RepID=UPI0036BAF784